jgi:hypothetical protein
MRMYDSLKRTHYILSLSMISFTHITYSVWVPNNGLPGFGDRSLVFGSTCTPFVSGNSLVHAVYHRFLSFFF